ncbi:MAG TPA: toprim domain-containing protein [Rectinema sp.]|nr:toprim domain-containing protein [Rectinema sp.]
MTSNKSIYDESKIKTLSSLEHIRLRTGMYIGRLGDGLSPDDGIYILLKEIIDNSVDEFIMGAGNQIVINLEGKRIRVRDYGRGIPLGKVIECVSVINTGAKYNDDVFQFSVGLNGVGTKAVNALSSEFRVVSYREGHAFEAKFVRGLRVDSREFETREKTGTLIEFVPDEQIFGEYSFVLEFIEKRLWSYACLNPGLKLSINGKEFQTEKGLQDLLSTELGGRALYDIGWYRGDHIEFAFTHTREYGEEHFSFVNGQYTSAGGTHLSAFREGFLKAINEFFQASYHGEDVREGLAAAISIRIKNPIFESQTKNKLGNSDVRPWILQEVKKGVDEVLRRNPQAAKILQEKILTNEKLRTELNIVRKEAKEAAKKIELKIPNLKDCKIHLGDGDMGDQSTIFITEGLSASGSMVSARNVHTQAIFSLRGKPENMFERPRSAIYKNEELYNLMMALGIENNVENLRFARIVIATDADYDGFHIRNLLLTFFLTFFEELVVQGRVYLLETPLFRVRTKKETLYCYSIHERDDAIKKLGQGSEVTRFKGLGEISPAEFGQFIGKNIRLVKVDIQTLSSVPELLNFFMGKNTPQRRQFIMDNLVLDL